MAQSIRNIVTDINTSLAGIFKGAKLYGVATSVEREGKSQPVVNELPVGFDDSYAMQMYHKINDIKIAYTPGYQRQPDVTNTFSMSAFVFNNEKITRLKSDEIAMIMQFYFNSTNNILPASVILDSQAIFAREYRGTSYALSEYASLFQFNYTVAIAFQRGCFDLCPEDFSQCKTN